MQRARTHTLFSRYAWFAVGYNLLVVLWGAFVRATGSGAGCGSHWPLCNGEVVPREPTAELLIELSHRITSGLDGLVVLALGIFAYRLFSKGHRVRWGALASLVFLLAEVLVGAGLVRFELVADNASAERAVVMAFHLINTFLLLAALTLTARWAGGGERPRLRRQGVVVPALLGLGCLGLLLLGASGAVTALGDTLFPVKGSASLGEALERAGEDLSPTTHFLVRLRIFHPLISVAVGAYALLAGALVARRRPAPGVQRSAGTVAGLFLVQMVCGLANVVLKAPVWMQLLHLLLADLVWIAFVLLAAGALERGAPRSIFGHRASESETLPQAG
jgi:protoheme IX farnesyltransferase